VREGENPESEGWRYYKNVADYLTGKRKLVITPEWARRPTHILDLADKSARKKTSLKTKYK
ncbi:MAG: Gfo/Idh/MocA family protein, partial [Candidatus Brocadiales bacterium]